MSKRLLPPPAQQKLDRAQQDVVDYLDSEIDRLRAAATPDDWKELYVSLMTQKRDAIDSLLTSLTSDLKIGGTRGRWQRARRHGCARACARWQSLMRAATAQGDIAEDCKPSQDQLGMTKPVGTAASCCG